MTNSAAQSIESVAPATIDSLLVTTEEGKTVEKEENAFSFVLPGMEKVEKPLSDDIYTKEHQKKINLYHAYLRRWDISFEETEKKFIVKNTDDEVFDVYAMGKTNTWYDCGCEDFVKEETGGCLHVGAVQRLLIMHPRIKHFLPSPRSLGTHVRYIAHKANFGGELQFEEHDDRDAFADGDLTIALKDIEFFYEKKPLYCLPSVGTAIRLWKEWGCYKRDTKVAALFDEGKIPMKGIYDGIPPKKPGEGPVQLRDYQEISIEHMLKWKRVALVLDMGKGKTLCAITVAYLLRDYVHKRGMLNVVICPKTLRSQWADEIKWFIPDMKPFVAESGKHMEKWAALSLEKKKECGWLIVSYETFHRHYKEACKDFYDIMILDEVQKIRNKETASWKAIKEIKSERCYALSGTIVENRLEDFLAVMDILNEREISPRWKFISEHCIYQGLNVKGFRNPKGLAKKFSTYLLKPIGLGQSTTPGITHNPLETKMEKKQIELHEHWFEKAKPLLAWAADGKPMSFQEKTLLNMYLLCSRLAANDARLLNKECTEVGGKIPEIKKFIEKHIVQDKKKIVIFSEWQKMISLIIKDIVEPLGIKYTILNGSMDGKKRKNSLTQFRTDSETMLFLATDAAGVGVDGLQDVCHIMAHTEYPWNPAKLDQRNGRLNRMGQNKLVDVTYFGSDSDIEKMIQNSNANKRIIREEVIGMSTNGLDDKAADQVGV